MLETLFVIGFVLIPLAVAVVLILYRARFLVVGLAGIVLVLVLIWMVLKASDIVERSFEPREPALSMPGNCPEAVQGQGAPPDCRL
ncbi:hypothetical protein MWN33_15520 [Starkeya koreensis]|uniref:Uncharacterized protein n=1 Tax=Ancylobacter koreensis TaxID=266121 RepID=A0ABT0DQ80_9HYPH|nr:hypothetical protein [Ancylobacter koreensis]MCK0209443.1 hypothetical protein [Ancylobacter koreensis]